MIRQDLRGKSRVRYNWIGRIVIAAATVSTLVLVLSGYFNAQALFIYAFLIGGSAVLRLFVQIRKVEKDVSFDKVEQENVLKWVLLGLLALEIGNLAYPGLYAFPVSNTTFDVVTGISFIGFLASFTLLTWENLFFFGEWVDIFLSLPYPRKNRRDMSLVKNLVGVVGVPTAALFFMGHHYWNYGQTEPAALLLVLLGGFVMAMGVYQTGFFLTAWVVHFVNNFFNIPFGQYILLILLGFAFYFYIRRKKLRVFRRQRGSRW